MTASDWRAFGLLTALVLATSLPFIHRAYFVDDFYHVTMAEGLLRHPTHPYDFLSNDAGPNNPGWVRGSWPRMVNPPLFHFYLAGVMKLWGDDSWKLRLATLVFPIVSVLCMYKIGERLVRAPLAASSLMAVTPAFWLTSYSLLIDGALLAFFLATLLVMIIAFERRSLPWLVVGGMLMGLTLLVKYFGVLIVPVVLLWQWKDADRRRWLLGYLPYVLAGAILLGWGIWTQVVYGQMHLLATLPRGFHGGKTFASYWAKLFVIGSFLSGSFIFMLASAPLLYRRMPAALLALIVGAAALLVLLISGRGGFTPIQSGMLVAFVLSSASFIALLAVGASNQRWLTVWWALGLLELIVIMPWTAGRYYLLILPPSIWIFQSMVESVGRSWVWPSVWVATAIAGGSLAYADLAQANVIVALSHAVARVPAIQAAQGKYFLGDTFTGYDPYLGPLGWHDAFPSTPLKTGDLLLIPRFRTSSWWALPAPERLHLVGRIDFPNAFPVRVMDVQASAGFYASVWGALPFAFTRDPLERFELYEVGPTGAPSFAPAGRTVDKNHLEAQ